MTRGHLRRLEALEARQHATDDAAYKWAEHKFSEKYLPVSLSLLLGQITQDEHDAWLVDNPAPKRRRPPTPDEIEEEKRVSEDFMNKLQEVKWRIEEEKASPLYRGSMRRHQPP